MHTRAEGTSRSGSERGLHSIPWRASYVTAASQSTGAAAEQAGYRKSLKYDELSAAYEFKPVAVDTPGPMDEATISFISELARKILEYSGDLCDSRISACSFSDITPFSSVKPSRLMTKSTRSHYSLVSVLFLTLGIYTTWGKK